MVDLSSIPTSSTSSLWDRITTWASENKAAVYTIAGVTLFVTGAGAVYYLSSSATTTTEPATDKKKARKDKKKTKKDLEKGESIGKSQEGMLA